MRYNIQNAHTTDTTNQNEIRESYNLRLIVCVCVFVNFFHTFYRKKNVFF